MRKSWFKLVVTVERNKHIVFKHTHFQSLQHYQARIDGRRCDARHGNPSRQLVRARTAVAARRRCRAH